MCEYPPGTFQFAERTMDMSVEAAHRGAKACRLRREACARQESSPSFFCRALAWLGRCLATWGERLQERYGPEESVPLPQVG
jgi:hypothetical protein